MSYPTTDIKGSELEQAMWRHLLYIVKVERRSFSFLDFKCFKIEGKEYELAHGTFRNKISQLMREGKVVRTCNSKIGFYSLNGITFGRKVDTALRIDRIREKTNEHYTNNCTYFTSIIGDLQASKRSLHDIHMKFSAANVWSVLKESGLYQLQPYSMDIKLKPMIFGNTKVNVMAHRTDTVTVSCACSNVPIASVIEGIMTLSKVLTRVEERISRAVDECSQYLRSGYERILIPDNDRWVVTMWHFGIDSNLEFTGKSFCIYWKDGRSALIRLYSKNLIIQDQDTGTHIPSNARIERQEYPCATLGSTVKEALKLN